VEENIIKIENVEDIDLNIQEEYDLILIGSPNHYGKHTKPIKNFIKNLENSSLKSKAYAVFDTYMFKDFEKAVKKMEKQISRFMPSMTKKSSGLSIRVAATKGPIKDEELPKCKEFGTKLAK
jgi:menaquinone-dependent protoporphyrinogen IX oxidase